MKQICKRANVPFFDLSARNSTPICSSKCRQTTENKVTFILIQPFCPSASSNGLRHRYPSPLLFHLCGRSAFSKWRRKKRFLPPLDKNARRIASSRTLKRKRTPRLLLPRWWESKRGVRSVHYTKVESVIESLLSRKATLYSDSHGENKRYTGVIPLSLGAFSIPASIRNSL